MLKKKKSSADKKKASVSRKSTARQIRKPELRLPLRPVPDAEHKAPVIRRSLKLTPAEKKIYKKALLTIRDTISGQITFLADGSLKRTEYDLPLDGGSEDFERDFALSLLSSEHDMLYEIDAAIKRLDDQTFGSCEQCGHPIAHARLHAIPFARMCIECQSGTEKDKPKYHPLGETIASTAARPETQSAPEPEE